MGAGLVGGVGSHAAHDAAIFCALDIDNSVVLQDRLHLAEGELEVVLVFIYAKAQIEGVGEKDAQLRPLSVGINQIHFGSLLSSIMIRSNLKEPL